MPDPVLLIGDIGGTHARLALAYAGRPGFHKVMKLSCEDYATAEAAIEYYLAEHITTAPDVICLAAAGPLRNDAINLTNNHWHLDRRSLAEQFATQRIGLLNDFEAVARSLPLLDASHVRPVGSGAGAAPVLAKADFTVGVLGPGTGLGVAGLLGRAGAIYPVVGEGGHRGFAPETARQLEVLGLLRERFPRVYAERLVSGPGLENIYDALRVLHRAPGAPAHAVEIFARAQEGGHPVATEAVNLFFEVLGQVAGDLALELGAFDGIFIAGGIAPRYPDLLERSRFRQAFEAKGHYRALLEAIPTLLIVHPDPGLLGAADCARRLWKASPGSSC